MAHINDKRRQRCVSETNYQFISKFHYQQIALSHIYRRLVQNISAIYSNLQVSLMCKVYIKVTFNLEQAPKAHRGSKLIVVH